MNRVNRTLELVAQDGYNHHEVDALEQIVELGALVEVQVLQDEDDARCGEDDARHRTDQQHELRREACARQFHMHATAPMLYIDRQI